MDQNPMDQNLMDQNLMDQNQWIRIQWIRFDTEYNRFGQELFSKTTILVKKYS
jgi:hypothetical protein